MHWFVKIAFAAGGLLVLQSAGAFFDGLRFLRLVRKSRGRSQSSYTPKAAVLIPCKGVDPGFQANVERFVAQDYPQYQIIFIVATREDPAYPPLLEWSERSRQPSAVSRPRTSLIVAGISDQRGEKVNNLLQGLKAVDPSAQVYVFADIDATPGPDWLSSLVAQLVDSRVTVSTGFRWYLPGTGLASRLRAAWDTSIATMMGEHGRNFAWGGSMAMRADDFNRLCIAEKYWSNTVSDDFALTRAVREAGGKIAFEPRCLVASREESTVRDFIRWSTRQIVITRVYSNRLWKFGIATYVFYCGTLGLGLIELVRPGAGLHHRVATGIILAIVLLLGAMKGYIRALVAGELFTKEVSNHGSCYWQLSPLVPWIMLWNFTVAGFKSRIEWRGTEYDLISQDAVRVIRRSAG